ncbi:MAG TPA: hypothetical protein VGI81_03175 [Tepidisphaeraceae bacterium]
MSTAALPKNQKGGYDVPRPGGKCAVSGREIAPGEKFVAAVRESATGLERLDVSLEAWNDFDRANLLGFWQTTMPRPEEKKKVFVDDQILCELFERLAEATEPGKVNFRFMLALVLMRKRLVVYEETRNEGGRDVWVVRMKGKDNRLNLVDPRLNETEMAEVSQQLGQILNEEL